MSVSSKRSHTSGEQSSSKSGRNFRISPPKINFFKFVAVTRTWRKLAKTSSSRSRLEKVKVPTQYENTYRTEPEPGKSFSPDRVEHMLKETLENRLQKMKYSAEKCRLVATELTAEIKSKVKAMEFSRYKLVCSVVITENKLQGLEIASRGVWNHSTDNFASYAYRNSTLIAIANVYGIYFE